MCAVGDAYQHCSPVGDGEGEVDLCHVCSGVHSVTHIPNGRWGRRVGPPPCMQFGRSLIHVPSWGGGKGGGFVPCT